MKKIQIKKLTVMGFCKFAEPVTWEFGNLTTISGHNHQGKSTIANAIAFALTGAPFFGGANLDWLQNQNSTEMRVGLSFYDEMEKLHELVRSRKDSHVTLSLDGNEMTQSRFSARFGNKDCILSLLNPLYFAEVLGANGRRLLEACLPVIQPHTVLEQLSESQRKQLDLKRLATPETYLKALRGELQEKQKYKLFFEGKKQQIDAQHQEYQTQLAEKRQKLLQYETTLLPFEQKRTEDNVQAIDKQLLRLQQQVEALTPSSQASSTIQSYQSKYVAQIAQLDMLLRQKREEYQREYTQANRLKTGTACPTCLRQIDTQSYPAVQAAYKKRLESIHKDGIALKDKLAEFQQAEYAQKQAASPAQREALFAQIRELTKRRICDGLTPEEASQYLPLLAEKNRLESEIDVLERLLAQLPNSAEADLQQFEQEIRQLNEQICALQFYFSQRQAMLVENLKMKHVTFRLYDIIKETGEMRDTFKLQYDGRDYIQLSLSEKMLCGLEIVQLLSKLTAISYPVFIDNVESLCDFGAFSPFGQLVLSRVVKGQPLHVQNCDIKEKAG